jgi:hypothetical protein
MVGLERLVDAVGAELGVDAQDLGQLRLGLSDGAALRQAGGEDHSGQEVAASDGDRIPNMVDRLLVLPEEVVGGTGNGMKDPGPHPDRGELQTRGERLERGLRISRVDGSVADREICQHGARVGVEGDLRLGSGSIVLSTKQIGQGQHLVGGSRVGIDLCGAPSPVDGLVELGPLVVSAVRPPAEEMGETHIGVGLGHAGVEIDGHLEVADCFFDLVGAGRFHQPPSLNHMVPRIEACLRLGGDPASLSGEDCRVDRGGDAAGDAILELKLVLSGAVISIRPYVTAIGSIDELGGDSNPVS